MNKIRKSQKPLAASLVLAAKAGCFTAMISAHSTTKEVGRPPRPSLQLNPPIYSYLRPNSRKPTRCLRHCELRAFSSCMAWRAIPSPLSKLKIRLDSLEATQRAPRDPRPGSREERSPLLPLRRGLTPRGTLECHPGIPVFP